jgi:hypothetical protein
MMAVVARRTQRIGVKTLELIDGRWYISLKNRTYYAKYEITAEKAEVWRELLRGK